MSAACLAQSNICCSPVPAAAARRPGGVRIAAARPTAELGFSRRWAQHQLCQQPEPGRWARCARCRMQASTAELPRRRRRCARCRPAAPVASSIGVSGASSALDTVTSSIGKSRQRVSALQTHFVFASRAARPPVDRQTLCRQSVNDLKRISLRGACPPC